MAIGTATATAITATTTSAITAQRVRFFLAVRGAASALIGKSLGQQRMLKAWFLLG
jgi:hypothetical protein